MTSVSVSACFCVSGSDISPLLVFPCVSLVPWNSVTPVISESGSFPALFIYVSSGLSCRISDFSGCTLSFVTTSRSRLNGAGTSLFSLSLGFLTDTLNQILSSSSSSSLYSFSPGFSSFPDSILCVIYCYLQSHPL